MGSPKPVRERPIVFSAPMIRAILAGKKTATRRICKPQPPCTPLSVRVDDEGFVWWSHCEGHENRGGKPCPFGKPGDALWVRESWSGITYSVEGRPIYRADAFQDDSGDRDGWWIGERFITGNIRWRSPIHMPRWASRLTLEIASVKVERVQDISAANIIAEGAVDRPHHVDMLGKCPVSAFDGVCYPDLRTLWAAGWEKIHGKGAWARNDYVWAITFRVPSPSPSAAAAGETERGGGE